MSGELVLDRRVVEPRVSPLPLRQLRSDVEHVHQHSGALDVGQEVVPEAGATARALDQPGDVGDHELAVQGPLCPERGVEHAQHRRERREGVVGDLRRRAGEARDQRGLARVRQPHEADIGQQLQLQLEPPFLAGQPTLGEPRRLPGRGGEALVALATAASSGRRRPLAVGQQLPVAPRELLGLLLGCRDLGSRRDADVERLPVGAVAKRTFAMPAPAGPEVAAPAERLQVAQGLVAQEHDVPAAPPVAAVGPPAGDHRFTAEAHAAVSPAPAWTWILARS